MPKLNTYVGVSEDAQLEVKAASDDGGGAFVVNLPALIGRFTRKQSLAIAADVVARHLLDGALDSTMTLNSFAWRCGNVGFREDQGDRTLEIRYEDADP